jgi:hypothetical protein
MPQDREFPVPHEVDEILERLPPRITLNVPDHVLAVWFPPGAAGGGMDAVALQRAQSYAQSNGCKFAYHRTTREGIFYRPLPAAKQAGPDSK